jgi:hypothetical protein
MRALMPLLIVSLLGVSLAAAPNGPDQEVTLLSGKVTDESGAALAGAVVHLEDANQKDIVTQSDGVYRFVVLGQREARLRFSRAGYQGLTQALRLQGGQVELDARLSPSQVQIQMTRFQSRQAIEGKVLGLPEHDYAAYKVVAYVLTNKWYIHPEAVNTPGSGFALLDSQGQWTLHTIWRRYQATHLAFLLVPRETWVPPTVELAGGRPETSLLGQIENVEAFLLIDPAPEGI